MPTSPEPPSSLLSRMRLFRPSRRVVAVADGLILLALVAAAVVVLSDGFVARLGDVRISVRTPGRPLVVALVLLAARRLLARGQGWFGTAPGATRRAIARWMPPQADAVTPLVLSPGARRRTAGLAVIGYAAVAAALLWPQLQQMHAVADLGDPLFSIWRLGWVFHQIQGDPRALFDANIFHPEPLTLTYSDAMLLTGLMAAPLLAAGVAPVAAYNTLLIAAFLASAITTFLLVRRLTGSPHAAFLAGLFYGFHPYRFEHYSHLELQMTHWMPLALLWLHRFVETRRVQDAVCASLCVVALLYSSMYYAVFFAIVAPVVILTQVGLAGLPVRRLAGGAVVAGLLAAALAVPLARPFQAGHAARGDRPLSEVAQYSATPADYLRPHAKSALYAGTLLPAGYGERALFPGFVVLVLAAGAFVGPLGVVRVAYAAGVLVAFDLSLGLNGVLYEPLSQVLSPVRGMRAAARCSIVVGLGLAVLAGFGTRRLLDRLPSARTRAVVLAVLAAALVAELRPTLQLQPVWPEPPATYHALADRPDAVLAEFPFAIQDPRAGWIDALPQMYFSVWHGRAMVNGYSGYFPPTYDALLEGAEQFPAPLALDVFRARGVTHLAVTCALTADPVRCDGLIERVQSSPHVRLVASSPWEGHPALLFELMPDVYR